MDDPVEIGQGTGEGMDQGNQQVTDSTVPNVNPAWNDLLGVVPSQLHSQVTPLLSKWDQNFQTKINEVHSQYEPWKPFMDKGVAPGDVEYALGLLNALSENPTEVIKALNEWAGADNSNTEQQGQFNQNPSPTDLDDSFLQHPKVQEMQQALETMAQIMLSQKDQEQQSAADAELESDLQKLRDAHGDFDEDLVLALAMRGDNFDYAALENAVKTVIEKTRPPRQPGPPVLGSGSAIPAQTPDITKASDTERRQLVAAMLQNAQQNT